MIVHSNNGVLTPASAGRQGRRLTNFDDLPLIAMFDHTTGEPWRREAGEAYVTMVHPRSGKICHVEPNWIEPHRGNFLIRIRHVLQDPEMPQYFHCVPLEMDTSTNEIFGVEAEAFDVPLVNLGQAALRMLDHLQATLDSARNDAHRLRQQNSELREGLDKQQVNKDTLALRVEKLHAENRGLHHDNAGLVGALDERDQTLALLTAEKRKVEAARDAAINREEKLAYRVRDLGGSNEHLKQQLADAQAQTRAAEAARKSLAAERDAAVRQLGACETELRLQKGENAKLRELIEPTSTREMKLAAKLAVQENEVKRLQLEQQRQRIEVHDQVEGYNLRGWLHRAFNVLTLRLSS